MDTYRINESEGSFTCLYCGKTSFNPHDYRERYCGNCHVFHEDHIHGGENQSLWQTQY